MPRLVVGPPPQLLFARPLVKAIRVGARHVPRTRARPIGRERSRRGVCRHPPRARDRLRGPPQG
jgi:hypothetical protein